MRLDGSIVLNPGLLRDQIVWQSKVITGQDAIGEDIFTWQNVVTCRAQVIALQGQDVFKVQEYSIARYQITQYYTKGLSIAMRIMWLVDGETLLLAPISINPAPGMRLYQSIAAKDIARPVALVSDNEVQV